MIDLRYAVRYPLTVRINPVLARADLTSYSDVKSGFQPTSSHRATEPSEHVPGHVLLVTQMAAYKIMTTHKYNGMEITQNFLSGLRFGRRPRSDVASQD